MFFNRHKASIRDCVEYFLQPKDAEELESFALWAFGEGYQEIENSLEFMNAWNDIHGHELYLHPDGTLSEDIQNMVELFKSR